MDQTHIGYTYWQEPPRNVMPRVDVIHVPAAGDLGVSMELNRTAPVVDRLSSSRAGRTEAITTLYLTALSRRPTADEVALMEGYLSRRRSEREGYRGVLWILLNSSEFALNR